MAATPLATDPASMIALIDTAIAQIVVGGLSNSIINGRTQTLLDLPNLRNLRQYYVQLRNQTSAGQIMLADVSDYRPDAGPNTTNQQYRGPTE